MRRFATNPAWKKRDWVLVITGCICVFFDLGGVLTGLVSGGVASGGALKAIGAALGPLLLATMGIAGLYRALPEGGPPPPPIEEGPFRTAQVGVPAPPRVSILGRSLLAVYVAIHVLLVLAGIVLAIVVVVAIGLFFYSCTKH
jgi:hypothetical protein